MNWVFLDRDLMNVYIGEERMKALCIRADSFSDQRGDIEAEVPDRLDPLEVMAEGVCGEIRNAVINKPDVPIHPSPTAVPKQLGAHAAWLLFERMSARENVPVIESVATMIASFREDLEKYRNGDLVLKFIDQPFDKAPGTGVPKITARRREFTFETCDGV